MAPWGDEKFVSCRRERLVQHHHFAALELRAAQWMLPLEAVELRAWPQSVAWHLVLMRSLSGAWRAVQRKSAACVFVCSRVVE
jgi:hypothetical protein